MIEYKHAHLGELPAGTYRYRGQELPYEHILPPRGCKLNFITESRDQITSFLKSNSQVKLHKYFHHLNSSQAFALNLFVPFFERGPVASRALLAALGQRTGLVCWEPEAIPDITEGTNRLSPYRKHHCRGTLLSPTRAWVWGKGFSCARTNRSYVSGESIYRLYTHASQFILCEETVHIQQDVKPFLHLSYTE